MSLAAALQILIDAGNDIQSLKYYASAAEALLFFDYFLTLPDEIEYAWKGRKTWIFYLFLLNRYVPILYEIWILVVIWWPGLTYEVCNHTAWIEIAIFVFITLLAQIFLTVRIYGLTLGNKMIAGFFCGVTIPQLVLGIYLVTLGAINPAIVMPKIPLEPFRLCVFARHRPIEIGYTCISLFYDLAAFAVIISFGLRNELNAMAMSASRPSIVKTIVHDATIYFFFIFTSHSVFVFTLVFARPTLQLLPAVGNDVFLPIMITRLMLSLKKAASNESGWSLFEMTAVRRVDEPSFIRHRLGSPARPLFNADDLDRTREGFRGTECSGDVLGDISEEIGMAVAKNSEEPC